MKAIRNLATLAAVAMLAAAFSPIRANAQGVVRGTFKLESQTRWGSANLEPGSYRFEALAPAGSSDAVREVTVSRRNNQGDDPTYYILGQIDGGASSAESNALLCQRSGPVCIVHTLQLGVAGETLTFKAPKSEPIEREARGRKNHAQQRQTVAAIETVPIVMSGK